MSGGRGASRVCGACHGCRQDKGKTHRKHSEGECRGDSCGRPFGVAERRGLQN